jgi:hypothetical protein
MIDFVERQIEASERLFKLMMEDHKERLRDAQIWADLNDSLQKKLIERDATIEILRARIRELEGANACDEVQS